MKAKYLGRVRDKYSDAVHLFYEYRGHEYMITDEHNGYSETMATKHHVEQKRIDRIIEEENKPKSGKPFEWSDLDVFFEFFE